MLVCLPQYICFWIILYFVNYFRIGHLVLDRWWSVAGTVYPEGLTPCFPDQASCTGGCLQHKDCISHLPPWGHGRQPCGRSMKMVLFLFISKIKTVLAFDWLLLLFYVIAATDRGFCWCGTQLCGGRNLSSGSGNE